MAKVSEASVVVCLKSVEGAMDGAAAELREEPLWSGASVVAGEGCKDLARIWSTSAKESVGRLVGGCIERSSSKGSGSAVASEAGGTMVAAESEVWSVSGTEYSMVSWMGLSVGVESAEEIKSIKAETDRARSGEMEVEVEVNVEVEVEVAVRTKI